MRTLLPSVLKKDEENPEQLVLKMVTLRGNKTLRCQSLISCHLHRPGMGKATSVHITGCFLVCHEVSGAATQLIDYVLSQCTTGKNI